MNRKKRKTRKSKQEFQHVCGALNEDDQVDPRTYFAPSGRTKFDRKSLQLCRQVMETLDQVLAGETPDELLQAVQVESVTPAPNSSQLLVVVTSRDPVNAMTKVAIQARLEERTPWLRSMLAGAIHRKKVPRLQFLVI